MAPTDSFEIQAEHLKYWHFHVMATLSTNFDLTSFFATVITLDPSSWF